MKYLASLLIAGILVLTSPLDAFAAGAFLNAANAGTTAGSSQSVSVNIPSGTTLFVVMAFRTILDINSPAAPTSATVAGSAMTDTGQAPTGDQNSEWIKFYYYNNPPTGSQTVAVSGGGGTAIDTGFMWAAYSGLGGTIDSSGATNKTTTTALALTTTVVKTNCWAIGMFANQGAGTPTYTNATGRVFAVPNDGGGIIDSNGKVSAGSYTMTVNQTSQIANGIAASFCELPSSFNPYFFWDF